MVFRKSLVSQKAKCKRILQRAYGLYVLIYPFHVQSTLEFNLRLQEYIELARAGKGMEAIAYAQKYLSPWQPTEFKRIQQAMTLLVFSSDTECQPYKVHTTMKVAECIYSFSFALGSLRPNTME